jgi:hypothetical protein
MKHEVPVVELHETGRGRRTRSAASLHSHSSCSRERLGFLPGVTRNIPIAGRLFDRSMRQLGREIGRPLDFDSVYWRPPASPASVIASEREQISARLDCAPLVALTDHDTLEGVVTLRAQGECDVPLSVEWSVRVADTILHLGIHGLAEARLSEAGALLREAAARRRADDVDAVLAWLDGQREAFVILNHPFWDFSNAGALRHETVLLSFLRRHRDRIHGLELNGYRGWSENRRVLALAEAFELSVVAGGDRHGYAPNAMVTLTDACSFAELGDDLRAGRPLTNVIFPEYFEPYAARVFQGFSEALRPDVATGRCSWGDRVFFLQDGVERSIASVWPGGGPWWLRGGFGLTRMLGTPTMRPLFRLAYSPGSPAVLF